ncbi:amino acid ABC transporter permease [Desulfosarcina sp.]|uniref:amino acid ABC transporter permease n=1 Tax=Desulfosarcina sp. TaxID=2027861 RepID=UPI003970779F
MIANKARITTRDLIMLAGVGVAAMWLLYQATLQAQYQWNWQAIPQYLLRLDEKSGRWVPGLILQGVLVTLRLSIWSTAIALFIGTVMGLFRISCSRYRQMIGTGYVEIIRNIPVLVWVFIFYYFIGDRLLPAIGISRSTFTDEGPLSGILRLLVAEPSQVSIFISGALALGVYEGAYITEITRAGIQSIDKGQWEASSGLGFTRIQQLRYVIFPQALRRVMPPLAGQFISTIKDSAIVSIISIQELTFQGMELMAATFLTFEVWITILAIYFVICLTCSLLVERFELHLKKESRPWQAN